VVLGAVAVLAAWRLPAPAVVTRLLLVGEVGLVAWAVQTRLHLYLIGPLLVYDLVRQARRGITTFLRCLYALILLGLLLILAANYFPQLTGFAEFFGERPSRPLHDWAAFAQKFVVSILNLQGIAVVLLTPAYLAGALAEEKERKTIIMLLATDLRDREIVLGKLLGRLLHLACFLLTGLPILLLARLWGGVDGNLLLAGFAVTCLGLLSVGSICILCSTVAPTVLTAVVSSYTLVLFLTFFCLAVPETSPFQFVSGYEERVEAAWDEWRKEVESSQAAWAPGVALVRVPPPDEDAILLYMLAICLAIHGTVFLGCTALAVSLLRDMCLTPGGPPGTPPQPRAVLMWSWDPVEPSSPAPRPRPAQTPSWDPVWPAPRAAARAEVALYRDNVPVCEPALLWKEAYHGRATVPHEPFLKALRQGWPYLLILFGAAASFFLFLQIRFGTDWAEGIEGLNRLVRVLTVIVAALWCVLIGFRVVGSVSREREQQTLEPLLLLPVQRSAILAAKWQGSILRSVHFGIALAILWAFGFGCGLLHAWAVVLLVALCAAHVAFLASLGLWLSLASRNTLWANMTMALVLLLVFGGVWLGMVDDAFTSYRAHDPDWGDTFREVGLNPGRAWWYAGFSWQECARAWADGTPLFWQRLTASLAGAGAYAAGAWLFWRLCCRRFERKPPAPRHRQAATPKEPADSYSIS
jgi:ABC-type transport system involved in multi-copper enzyme maturation permease subunit